MQFDFDKNYFELFNLPESYTIDEPLLKENYRKLQWQVHPDRLVGHPARERLLAFSYSSFINEAYSALISPIKRAAYLLKLKGIDVDFEKNTQMDPAFLMEQIRLREAMHEIRHQEDPEQALKRLKQEIESNLKVFEEKLVKAFLIQNQDSLEEAKTLIRKMQFLYRLLEECEHLHKD